MHHADIRITHRMTRSIFRSVSVALVSQQQPRCSAPVRPHSAASPEPWSTSENARPPLPGVAVVAIRKRDAGMIVDTGTTCDDVQLTYTDAQGRFHFSPASPASMNFWSNVFLGKGWVFVTVYKRGYHSTQGADAHCVNSASMPLLRWRPRRRTGRLSRPSSIGLLELPISKTSSMICFLTYDHLLRPPRKGLSMKALLNAVTADVFAKYSSVFTSL
jgi:hypothetical protein